MRRAAVLFSTLILGCQASILGPSTGSPGPTARGVDADQPVASSRVPRLSHAQYENTVQDLLGLTGPTLITQTFVGDATTGTFTNVGGELAVNGDLWTDYQRAAETLAAQATATPADLARLAGGTWPATPDQRIAAVGRRAFRRPLTAAELTAYRALYDEGPADYPALDPSVASARLVLEAMLQSPHFLYRPELSTRESNGVIALSGPELATRLSYALWQSMPDEDLLAAGESGALSSQEGYSAQVARLLANGQRLRATVATFHDQLLGVSNYADLTRSTATFPEFTPTLGAEMVDESRRFVEAVVFDEQAGLARMLTAPYTFASPELGRVYGLTLSGGVSKVTFDDARRAGLLTQVGFLAVHSSSTDPDPIHRGVFVNRKILCAELPAPPNNVPPLPPLDPMAPPKTMRQRITEFTGAGTCGAGCHSTLINPAGFAYERFDALGRWRDTDRGLPVDTRDTYSFEGTARNYDGATDFAQAMANEPMAHKCYSRNWLEFLYGRRSVSADQPLVRRIGALSRDDQASVIRVLDALVTSESFTARGVEP